MATHLGLVQAAVIAGDLSEGTSIFLSYRNSLAAGGLDHYDYQLSLETARQVLLTREIALSG
ncbi:MAG: hypothetical protein U0930_12000 [Pirellulales bacterium]